MHGLSAKRLRLVRELGQSLLQAQRELLASRLEDFEKQTRRQQELCEEWKSLLAEPERRDCSAAEQQELSQAQAGVSQQARIYAAMLRRAGRTVNIFCRVLANAGPTYAEPSPGR